MAQGDNVVAAMLASAIAERAVTSLPEAEQPTAIVRLFLEVEAALNLARESRRQAAQQAILERRTQLEQLAATMRNE